VAIGKAPKKEQPGDVEKEAQAAANAAKKSGGKKPATAGLDPLDDKLWGLKTVKSDLARKVNAGDKRVTVGILDTGVDASNPDIAPNFNWALSKNFAPDKTDIDGPCEVASFGTDTFRTAGNEILSTYPKKVLQEEGSVDAAGNVLWHAVQRLLRLRHRRRLRGRDHARLVGTPLVVAGRSRYELVVRGAQPRTTSV
jgi:subtilisin family serine protease